MFLWVFLALSICSILIYGIILTVLPKQYQITFNKTLETNSKNLIAKISDMRYGDAVREINNFCIQNNSAAKLSDGNGALSFGDIAGAQLSDFTSATSSIAASVTFIDSEKEYSLVISSISETSENISNLMLQFLPAVLVIIFVLSFLSAFICSKVIVAPIAKISQISKRMTALDMTWKCDIKSNDEIGVLADSLNKMAMRLQETMKELTNANNQLTDDIDKFKTLEEQRKNFFAAVSHELKTPLTILKGQIENMIFGYGDYKNHDKYLPEALNAAEDIEHLVKEIIAISKMENMNLQDTLQRISLKQSVNYIIQAMLPLAQDKNIQIHQNINTDIILSVNPNLWNKVLSNIIGNAVRHSPCNENIFISLQYCADKYVFVVENTGTFIPEPELSHMFTPFYRADKSRSKATGGSGLGLYIVKTILDLHNISYCIKNTAKGVAFFLYIN